MQAYETSTKTLRAALARPELQRDRVDATLEGMAEALADQREIDEAIRVGESVAVGDQADEDELASELAMLVKEAETEQRAEKEREEKERKEQEKERKEIEARQQEKQDEEMARRLAGLKVQQGQVAASVMKEAEVEKRLDASTAS